MKRQLYYMLFLVCLAGLTACEKADDFRTRSLLIRLIPPEGFERARLDSIPVSVTNQSIGTVYTLYSDSTGCARADLTAGTLQINIQQTLAKGYVDYIVYGGHSALYFETEGEEQELDIKLGIAEMGRLLIEEIYFSGCMRPDGKTAYVKDQYMTIANNSGETIYLDGICIGQVAPATTAKPSGWMLHTDMEELPLFLMCWQFPGSGTEHPLLPGERQVIATNAVDHRAGEAGVPASVDLSKADWAFWNPTLKESQISSGVKPLNLLWRTGGSSYALSTSGPTVVLFLPGQDINKYIADASHIQTEPGTTSKQLFLHIPADWVQDAVNLVSSVATKTNTRIPLSMDANPGIAKAQGSGTAVYRFKPRQPDGFRLWADSNNTLNDFRTGNPSLRKP